MGHLRRPFLSMLRCLLVSTAATIILAESSQAVINPQFTPVQLVAESNTILVGTLSPGTAVGRWTLKVTEALKGEAPKDVAFSMGWQKGDDAATVAGLLKSNGDQPVIWFGGHDGERGLAYLHVEGTYLELRPVSSAWGIQSIATKFSGVFAGGTDMLIRMVRYILADPEADVPVAVGVSWKGDAPMLGRVSGTISSILTVRTAQPAGIYVFVASDGGDRLWRAKEKDEAFEDVTAGAGLQTYSKQALWTDLLGDSQPQLFSWDGEAVTAWRWAGGKIAPIGKPLGQKTCLGLSACRTHTGGPAIVVSTAAAPFLLSLDNDLSWRVEPLPPAKADDAGETACPCIVADLDNDGYFDVLQPRSKSGLLWRGKAGGFAEPVRSPVTCEGPGRLCLGDFDGDGFLDIFVSGPKANGLWQNDGNGGFVPVLSSSGSLAKAPAGASCCLSADLNHDGRTDLILLYAKGEFSYHFNRGFRCFGEEGGLRLNHPESTPGDTGQVACAAGDINSDGALDLATAFADGTVTCQYNEALNKPLLRVRRGKGLVGPLPFRLYQGEKAASCLGLFTVDGPEMLVPLRDSRDCTIRYALPGRADQVRKVSVPKKFPKGGLEITLEAME